MKLSLLAFASQMVFVGALSSQINLGGICNDKWGNMYCGGHFNNVIDLGNNNLMKSAGANDVFIGKYSPNGSCLWASRFGNENDMTLSDICCDQVGNTYFTGNFTTDVRFGSLRLTAPSPKVYPSPNFYIAKLNVSGDPVWVRASKNLGLDEGCKVTTDPSGNIYVAGVFDNKLECDGKSVSSNGNGDLFIMKLGANGNVLWLKNFGDKGDNSCNAIYYSKDRLYTSSTQGGTEGYNAQLLCLQAGTGEMIWTKELGSKKGSIEAITLDESQAVLITGYIESKNNSEDREMVVAKYSGEGADIWMRRLTGGLPIGRALTTDPTGNIFVAGDYSDSLRSGRFNVGGYPKEDVFFARFNSSGVPQMLVGSGNSKVDRGSHLHLWNNKVVLGGTFTSGLTFGKMNVKGWDNTIFIASFETGKNTCEEMKVLATEILGKDEVDLTNIYGKLLIGAGENKEFLTEQPVHLEDQNGEILKRTVTDEKGDFSFKNINPDASVNLVIEKSEKIKDNDEVYVATQTGLILDKVKLKGDKFVYPVLTGDIVKMREIEEEDISLKFTEFGKGTSKEFMITERISYEPNSWSIPSESIPYLNKLVQQMKQYSKLMLEINSYTDVIGEDDFNKNLSAMRGEEVKEYLIRNKISATRITVKGHGEDNILNRCTNGVKCSESEHAYNRRIEFRFFMGSGL